MPQVNAAELYVSSEPLAEVDVEEVQQTTTSLQFTTLDDGCTTMGVYTLSSQDHAANTSETFQPQETHLGEEDEEEDHAANNGENLDDMDEYEERIERGDFDRDMDDHELVPNFERKIWSTMMKIPFVSTWGDGMHFSKGLTFANKEAVKHALIIYAAKDSRNFKIQRLTKTKLYAACIDTNCKWYVGAFMKAKLNGLQMVMSYVGPHSCIPFGLRRAGKTMDSNFFALEIVEKLREDHTARID
ncbi:hypothetical protein SO802_005741 [Lithocarpus litseifolius]|uniref:Transposase MuDR plant domain-containing protein n=1 Tax=Lithocarpus litseifolius TaxID=425828 RepID=A0AAW2DLS6_9ROSI